MMGIRDRQIAAVTSMLLAFVLLPDLASAHGVFGKDAVFLQGYKDGPSVRSCTSAPSTW